MLLVHLAHHGVGHRLQVFHVLAQWWHVNVKDIQAIEEIGSQMAVRHSILRIAIRCGQDANIHVLLGTGSQPAQFSFFQDAQQLRLRADRHFAQLIQQQRPARGQFEASGAPFYGSGEGAFLVAKNLAFDQRFRNGRAIHREEGRGLCAG